MAGIRRTAKKTPTKKGVTTKTSTPKSRKQSFVLPTEKRKPTNNIEDFSWLIYGDKKIGKTSLCSMFPDALIYGFEPGTKALEVFAVDIPNWEAAQEYNDQLFGTDHPFKNIVIDTGKIAYDRNMQYICDRENINHPSDQAYGKGWAAVNKSFEKFHLDLTGHGLGMVVIAHEKTTEKELPNGLKMVTIEPDLSGSSLNFYHGMVDIIGRYHFIGTDRYLTIRGNESEVAGCRMKENFLTPDGEQIVRIPMGNSEEEAYENMMLAFNNKQTKTYADVDKPEPKKQTTKKRRSR